MLSRILEEGGELAQQVAHFEDSGIKRQKYGEPDRHKLATEVKGVLIAALQIAQHTAFKRNLVNPSNARIKASSEMGLSQQIKG